MHLDHLPRQRLASLPTPLQPLERLSKALGGPQIWIKRDDQTGLALGGNKARKLEFLVADALRQGCDTLVTAGAAQSNHCRQTAAAAAASGLDCHLVLGGEPPAAPNGNLLLDQLLGASVHWSGPARRGETLERVVAALHDDGRHPYAIPYGGSNALGALGFVAAAEELRDQLRAEALQLDTIVIASSSGGTQAGLAAGLRLLDMEIELVGIGIDKGEAGDAPYREQLATLASAAARLAGSDTLFAEDDFIVDEGYLGAGYGIPGDLEREAIGLLARSEGILVDPVYTGRAFGGMLDQIRQGRWGADQTLLFWHTGGAPALFHHAAELAADVDTKERG